MLKFLYVDETMLWAMYSSGVTLAVTMLAGMVLLRLASDSFLIPVMTDVRR